MKVLYHLPYWKGLGADRWICEGWKDGFEELGHGFHIVSQDKDILHALEAIRPTLFFSAVNILHPDLATSVRYWGRKGTTVLLWVHWPLEASVPRRWRDLLMQEDVADIYFGEREPEQMANFELETGKKYHVIPNAANPRVHFPTQSVGKYEYDVVYLGANLPNKRWFVENVLQPTRAGRRVAIFGPGWNVTDHVLRAISKASRLAGLRGIAQCVDRHRISIPPDEENLLYSSAKISLNFHEREPDGSQPHYIVNQRTFKIPACGGFQICDYVPAIRKYFSDDEVVLASLDAREWHDKIEYYLAHDEERRQIQAKGTKRALQEHLSTNRVRQVLSLLGIQERHVG